MAILAVWIKHCLRVPATICSVQIASLILHVQFFLTHCWFVVQYLYTDELRTTINRIAKALDIMSALSGSPALAPAASRAFGGAPAPKSAETSDDEVIALDPNYRDIIASIQKNMNAHRSSSPSGAPAPEMSMYANNYESSMVNFIAQLMPALPRIQVILGPALHDSLLLSMLWQRHT